MTEGKVKSIEKVQKSPTAIASTRTRHPGADVSPFGFGGAPVPQMAGNLAVQQLFRSGAIQAKLSISQPHDPDEQEADRVADHVMRMADPGPIGSSPGVIHRTCAACSAGGATCPKCEEEEKIKRKEMPGHTPHASPAVHSQIAALRGGGQPLAPSVRAFFEPRFGRDFSGVRVHTGGQAAESAKAIKARAYTHGQDVAFGEGEYAPESKAGQGLLAHELAHVVQQGQATPLEGGGELSSTQQGGLPVARADNRIARQDNDADAGPPPSTDVKDAGATSGVSPDAPGGEHYSKQASCVARLGGCISTIAAGMVEPEDIARYNRECRQQSSYPDTAPDITPNPDECRQYTSGELVDPAKITRLQTLSFEYMRRLTQGELNLGDAEKIDAALRRAHAALLRGGATLPALPEPVAPPSDMPLDGPAVVLAGLPALAPVAETVAPPTLTLIQGGAGVAATAGGDVAATGGAVAAGGAATTVAVVLVSVVALVGVGLILYFIFEHEDPKVDPTIPKDLDEAINTIEDTLKSAKPPKVQAPLPDIGQLPQQRRHLDQTCTNEELDKLQDEVNNQCKVLPRACSDTDDCQTLRRNWFRNERCAKAREKVNECFGGGNPGHRQAAEAARKAEQNCRELYRRKRC